MKADDRDSPARSQKFVHVFQELVEVVKLRVNSDPQRLESPGRGIDVSPFSWNAPANDLGKSGGGSDRFPFTFFDDPASNSPTVTFLAVFEDDVRQILGGESVDEIGRGLLAIGVESHIQRAVVREAEPSVDPAELVGRETQVEDDPIQKRDSLFVQNPARVTVGRMMERDRETLCGLFCECQHVRVAVDSDHPPSRFNSPCNLGRMAPRANGSVKHDRAWLEIEPFDDLSQEH